MPLRNMRLQQRWLSIMHSSTSRENQTSQHKHIIQTKAQWCRLVVWHPSVPEYTMKSSVDQRVLDMSCLTAQGWTKQSPTEPCSQPQQLIYNRTAH